MNARLGWLFRIPTIRDTILNNLAPESLWYAPDVALQNVTGQPAISLPTFWNKDNMPLGVQFVGRYAEEYKLIDLSAQIEESNPWISKDPLK